MVQHTPKRTPVFSHDPCPSFCLYLAHPSPTIAAPETRSHIRKCVYHSLAASVRNPLRDFLLSEIQRTKGLLGAPLSTAASKGTELPG